MDIEALDNDQLATLISQANKLQAARRQALRNRAIAEAKAILHNAGVSVRALDVAKTQRRPYGRNIIRGKAYRNPDNHDEKWIARWGRRPNWLNQLLAEDRLPEQID